MATRGRKSKLTPELQARMVALVKKGVPRERAARLAGVSDGTYHRWMQTGESQETGVYRDFRDAIRRAEDELVQRAVGAVTDQLAASAKPENRLRAAKFILTHRYGKEFTPRSEVTGPEGAPVQVQAQVEIRPLFTDEQVSALTPELLAAAIGQLVTKLADPG